MTKIIIDTDIGTDVDDALAIAYAVRTGLDIGLITTVHGDTALRARIAHKLTSKLLKTEIPVAAGERQPVKQNFLYWSGQEGKNFVRGYMPPSIRHDGVEALIEKVEEHKHDVTVVSIGPLTNIAKALQRHPPLEGYINHIYMMGNVVDCEHLHLNYRAHNFKADPEAVDIVMESKIPKTIITTDVCKKNWLTKDELEEFRKSSDPVLRYLSSAGRQWMDYSNYDVAYLYDPLVVHHAIDDSITEKKQHGSVAITTAVLPGFKEIFLSALYGGKQHDRP